MKVQFTEDTIGELVPTIHAMESDPAVDGVAALVADESDLDTNALDTALQALEVPVFGGIFPELIYSGSKRASGAIVAGLAVEPTVTTVEELSDPAEDYAVDLDASLVEADHDTAFVLVDAFAARIGDFVQTLFTTYGLSFNFIGGGAGSLSMEQKPCLFTNEGILEDSAVLVTIDVASSIGVQHGWQEVDGPFRVTGASGTTLETLDDEPAFDVYKRIVEADSNETVQEENFFEIAKSYPFGISRMDGEKIVRDPFEVGEGGSLNCFGNVPEGEFVHVLRGDPETLTDAANRAYENAMDGAVTDDDTIFFFDCISRVLYLEDTFERELAAIGGEESPAIGVLTLGEIANSGDGHLEFYNKTAVVGAIHDI